MAYYNRFRVLHAVDSLNLKHELKSKKSEAILYHADISKRYSVVCHLKIVFNFLHELKQMSSDVTGRHERLVDSDVIEGVITNRSNRMKFRLSVKVVIDLSHQHLVERLNTARPLSKSKKYRVWITSTTDQVVCAPFG